MVDEPADKQRYVSDLSNSMNLHRHRHRPPPFCIPTLNSVSVGKRKMQELHQNTTEIHLRLSIACKGDRSGNADRRWLWRVVVGITVWRKSIMDVFERVVLVGRWPLSTVRLCERVSRSLAVGLLHVAIKSRSVTE